MPELPDVELFRRRLEAHGLCRPIVRVVVTDARILHGLPARRLTAALEGQQLTETLRRGKHLLARIDGNGWLTLHFGMTGDLRICDQGDIEPAYTRVRLDFADGGWLAYVNRRMLGAVGLADDADAFIAEQPLGPDALSEDFTAAMLGAELRARRTTVKAVLMDQAIVAGLGNIYADEALFQAGIHPATPANRLSSAATATLHKAITSVLNQAIAYGAGSEIEVERLPDTFLISHRAEGEPCPRCGTPIETLRLGGRQSYFCRICQPPPQA